MWFFYVFPLLLIWIELWTTDVFSGEWQVVALSACRWILVGSHCKYDGFIHEVYVSFVNVLAGWFFVLRGSSDVTRDFIEHSVLFSFVFCGIALFGNGIVLMVWQKWMVGGGGTVPWRALKCASYLQCTAGSVRTEKSWNVRCHTRWINLGLNAVVQCKFEWMVQWLGGLLHESYCWVACLSLGNTCTRADGVLTNCYDKP